MENGMSVITIAEEMAYPYAQQPELAKNWMILQKEQSCLHWYRYKPRFCS